MQFSVKEFNARQKSYGAQYTSCVLMCDNEETDEPKKNLKKKLSALTRNVPIHENINIM